ncbi:MAG TPA: MFS transporter, partial [Rhizomicrobium sp.]|nr:MFS transporter [Rhizomicrobium sp.]
MRGPTLFSARWSTFAVFFANGFGFGAWTTVIAPLKAMLGLSPGQLSIALLLMSIGGVIAMQPASRFVQSVGGTGRATQITGIVYALVLTLPLFSPGLAVLCAATALLGGSICLMDVSMNSHATYTEKLWGSAINSSFHAGWSLGGLAGTSFGALVLALHLATHFLLLPAAVLVLAVVLLASPHLGPGDTQKHEPKPIFRLPERAIAGLALVLTLCFMAEGAMADWSAIYLTTLGETAARATAGYAAFSAMMVIGRMTGDFVVQRFGRAPVIGAGCALAAAGLIAATAFPYFAAVVAGFALVGAGLSNVVPCVFSTAAARASSPAAGISEVSTAGFG